MDIFSSNDIYLNFIHAFSNGFSCTNIPYPNSRVSISHYMNELALRAFDLYLAAILDFLTMWLGEGKFAKGVGKDHFLSWDYLRLGLCLLLPLEGSIAKL